MSAERYSDASQMHIKVCGKGYHGRIHSTRVSFDQFCQFRRHSKRLSIFTADQEELISWKQMENRRTENQIIPGFTNDECTTNLFI